MAADVSSTSLLRVMKGGDGNESEKSTAALITRDLLGGCCTTTNTLDTKELDLDLQVPCGWEKRLDLKSGKIYLQRCNSTNSSSSTTGNTTKTLTTTHPDINYPPRPSKQTLNLFNDPVLDLKLVPTSTYNQSVCTLDKVKSALERSEKETGKRSAISTSFPRSNNSSMIKDFDRDQAAKPGGNTFAAGCPNCLLYVLISRNNPKCPRCNCNVPLPVLAKKRRIDLNISM